MTAEDVQKRDLLGATLDAISDLPHINALALMFTANMRLSMDTRALLALFKQYVPDAFKSSCGERSSCVAICTRTMAVQPSVFADLADATGLTFKQKVSVAGIICSQLHGLQCHQLFQDGSMA